MNWWRSAGVWNPLTDRPSSWSLRSSISSSSPPTTHHHITASRWGRTVSSSNWFHWRMKPTHHVSSQLYRNIFDCTEEEVGGGGDMLKGGDDDEERRQTGNQPGPPQLLLRDRSPQSAWLLPLFTSSERHEDDTRPVAKNIYQLSWSSRPIRMFSDVKSKPLFLHSEWKK